MSLSSNMSSSCWMRLCALWNEFIFLPNVNAHQPLTGKPESSETGVTSKTYRDLRQTQARSAVGCCGLMAQGNLDRETHEDRKAHHRSGLHLASVGPATRQENESQTSAPLPAALISRPGASQSRLQNPPPLPQVNRYTTTSATTLQFFRHQFYSVTQYWSRSRIFTRIIFCLFRNSLPSSRSKRL